MSCPHCNDNDEGCSPLKAVDKAIRPLARDGNSCAVELTGLGVVTVNKSGAQVADGSYTKPICLGDLVRSVAPNILLGANVTELTPGAPSSCLVAIQGEQEDIGKVIKWTGTGFSLRSLLESLCYPSDVVQNTCCPSSGLAVWSVQGDSSCLQKWDPCAAGSQKSVTNPIFLVCEDGGLIGLPLCDLPDLVPGTTYQAVVCTEDGPRVMSSTVGPSTTRQFIPFDLLGSGKPMIILSQAFNESDGTSISIPLNLAVLSEVAIPAGASHVQLLVNILADNDSDNDPLSFTLYSPAAIATNNRRGFVSAGNESDDFSAISPSFTVPIVAGSTGILIAKSGGSSNWDLTVDVRIEGYWVG